MKTIRFNLYPFAGLSANAKTKVLATHYHIDIVHGCWGSTYDDAGAAGLKIKEVDLGRNSYCNAGFKEDAIAMRHPCYRQVITARRHIYPTILTEEQIIKGFKTK